jgi:hypothetical protein
MLFCGGWEKITQGGAEAGAVIKFKYFSEYAWKALPKEMKSHTMLHSLARRNIIAEELRKKSSIFCILSVLLAQQRDHPAALSAT